MENRFKFEEDVEGFFGSYIICVFIIIFSFGLATPWAICRMERWRARNTSLNGKKTKFVGDPSALLGKFIVWLFLAVITFGIYGIWMAVKMQKWVVENTIIEE